MRVLPIHETGTQFLVTHTERFCLVNATDTIAASDPLPLGLLMGFYGLTRAEAHLAAHLAEGRRLKDIPE